MKKLCRAGIMLFVAFLMFLAVRLDSKAATEMNMNVAQLYAGSTYIQVGWNGTLGVNHYHVLMSDGTVTADMGHTTSTTEYIRGLSSNTLYALKIVAFSGTHDKNCSLENAQSVSEAVIVSTSLGAIQEVTQIDATTDSVTLSWSAVSNAAGYRVESYNNYGWRECGVVTTNRVTLTGLNLSSQGNYRITPIRKNAGGYIAEGGSKTVYNVKPLKSAPGAVVKTAITNLYSSLNEIRVGWTSVSNADGYQLQVQDMKGKTLLFEDQGNHTYKSISQFWKGKAFKIRARAYVKNGDIKTYGGWSPYCYCAESKKVSAVRYANRKKISVKWKKVTGISSYQVYISTKLNSGYKKVKTLGKNGTKCIITKYGKKKLSKNKTYYVKLTYQVKVGKKKVTTAIVDRATCY